MCHLPLFMPVIALPVLWLLPLSLAVPLYAVIVLISGSLYWLVVKSMRKRPLTGVESLIGSEAEVVSGMPEGPGAQYLVRSQGELWTARSADALQPGETVCIAGMRGIILVVERRNDVADPPHDSEVARVGAKAR